MATPKELGTLNAEEATVIGPSILIDGKLSGDEDLTVRGRVEGELTLSKTLIVEPSGIVKANVSVRNAVVSGAVVGNITATESVELTKDGRMVGDISSPRVIIVDGASFRGRVDMGNASEHGEARPQQARRPVAVAPAPRPSGRIQALGRPQAASRPSIAAMTKPLPPPPRRESSEPMVVRSRSSSGLTPRRK